MEDLHNVEYRTERKRVRLRWNKKQNSSTIAGYKINLREIEECIFIK